MNRTNVSGGRVVEGAPHFADDGVEVRFADERGGPQRVVELFARDGARAVEQQDLEQLLCFGRQPELQVSPPEQPGTTVEREFAESENGSLLAAL